jgi:hypothetical protein
MNDTFLERLQAAARVADRATMTGASPNRIIHVLVWPWGISVQGRDTPKGGGVHKGKEVNRYWAQITDADVNVIEQAVEEVCAWLDRETRITLI